MASSSRPGSTASSSGGANGGPKETLLQRLHREKVVSEHFHKEIAALRTNVERVDTLYSHMEPFLEASCEDQDFKCDEEANKLRITGDALLIVGKYLEALKYYTRSIANAASSDVMIEGLIQRSEALLLLRMGTECETEILKIMEKKYPPDLKDVLMQRLSKAHAIKNPPEVRHEIIPAVNEYNAKVQAVSSSIEMRTDDAFGRHMVATKDIKLGEVLGIEEALVATLFVNEVIHCHECFKVCYNPIPCDACTQVVYCNEDCKTGADIYHKYECVVRRKLDRQSFKSGDLLALKLTISMRDEYPNLENYRVPEEDYRTGRFQEVCTLKHHLVNFPSNGLLNVVYRAAHTLYILKTYTDFFNVYEPAKYEEIFKDLIVVNRARIDVNQCLLSELSNVQADYFEYVTFGTALYPTFSLFNHGCYYNVIGVHYGTKIVMRAVGTIKKGEQCFVNYQLRYDTNDRILREQVLGAIYNFRCTCRACVHHWPTFPQRDFLGRKNTFAMKVMRLNSTRAIRGYTEKMQKQLKQLEPKMPTKEFNVTYVGYEFCLRACGNQRPAPSS